MNVRWTPSAVDDLSGISSYLEKHAGLTLANRACRALYDSVQLLRNQPRLGKPGKRSGTRELVEGGYIIVYRLQPDSIEVLRIWHSAQSRR